MKSAPKSVRLHIGIFGRTNTGKSTFLNLVCNQQAAITSASPGTTTDVVEKKMELLPLGPVVFHDTGGVDDSSKLGKDRIQKAKKALNGVDIATLVVEADKFTTYEEKLIQNFKKQEIPYLIIINKTDKQEPSQQFKEKLTNFTEHIIECSSIDSQNRDRYINSYKKQLIELVPEDHLNPPTLVGDLIPEGEVGVLVVPLDMEAPKGRLILPQVQTIRNALDNNAATAVVKETEYPHLLKKLNSPPAVVICDSQVVGPVAEQTPNNIPLTTFSILFARRKGELPRLAAGASILEKIGDGDKILIAEACSHHPIEGDIGREKIPNWINKYTGAHPDYDVYSGRDFPDNLSAYRLIIHCGGCMINRRRMLYRFQRAQEEHIPITNYGVCISAVHNLLERTLEPFP
ncbi:MAG: [FeFe] hydrogenase H-cluster maturation GTPase HydF, partial [bacterium]